MQILPRICLILGIIQFTESTCEELEEKEWWETALIYQIWPRAFQDSDGNGEGDLQGIISRLDYIKDLGVDAIWLNPIYESPWIDSGYDITDHNKIHPTFGDFEDMNLLIEEAHERDLKVILDIVPNHSSIKHLWFNLSREEIEPYDDFYIWANGTDDDSGNRIEPNDWVSFYDHERNGSAWTWDENREQWYYHKFHHTQPDLNLKNEDVVQQIMETLDFWLEKGADGFFFSAVSYYFEDDIENENDNFDNDDDNDNNNDNDNNDNNNDYQVEIKNIELLYRFQNHVNDWIKENNSTSKLLLSDSEYSYEMLIPDYGNGTQNGIIPINFRFIRELKRSSDAEDIKNTIQEWMDSLPENSTTNWMLTNHDNSRTPSRVGLEEMDGFQILSLLLPGQAFTYYGEEIAMTDTQVPWDEVIDPMTCDNPEENYENFSRDFARTPMQWNSSISAGFSSSDKTFLPLNPLFKETNVEDQLENPFSSINIYKKVACLRKESPVFTHGGYELESLNNNKVILLKRFLENYPIYIIVINLEASNETINLTSLYPELEDDFEIVISTDPDFEMTEIEGSFLLSGNEAVVLKGKADANETTTLIFDEDEENNFISTTEPDEELTDLNSEESNANEVSHEQIKENISDKDMDENGGANIFQNPLGLYCTLVLIFWFF